MVQGHTKSHKSLMEFIKWVDVKANNVIQSHSPFETFHEEKTPIDQQVDESGNSDFYDSNCTLSHEHMVSDTTSEDNLEISINGEPSFL